MKTDSKKLDEKFGIVRDKYGREISRNGVANPYYVSQEEMIEREKEWLSIKDDKEKRKEYITKIAEESIKRIQLEDEKTSLIAKKRLEEILVNPTSNFYDKCIYASQDISDNHDINLKKKKSLFKRR